MNAAALDPAGAVPKAIVRTLKRLIRRVRLLIVLRGACAVAATAVSMLLVVMAVDATVTLFSLTTRWVLTLTAYGATLAAAFWFLARPLAHSYTLAGIARAIETRHPELQERISSSVELLTSQDAPEIRGSDQLIEALVEQATDNVRGIQPRREVTLKAAKPYLVAAAVVAAVLGGLFAVWPDQAAFLFTRATAPFINLPNLHARDLRVSPGDCVVAEGDRLQVSVAVPNTALRSADLRLVGPDGSEAAQPMAVLNPADDDERRFALTCPPAEQTFRYRVHAGDALSRYYTATVVPRPAVERVDVRYDYPQYAKLDPRTERDASGHVAALRGTDVTLTVWPNKRVESATFLVDGRTVENAETTLGGEPDEPVCTVAFKLTPDCCGHWSLELADEHGFLSTSEERAIEMIEDTPPTASILAPEDRRLTLPPTARVPLSFALEDDQDLGSAELRIHVDGDRRPSDPLPLPRKPHQRLLTHVGEHELRLATLELRNAKYVTFQLRVADTRPRDLGGPQHGESEVYRIDLDVRAPSFAAARVMDEEKQLRERLENVKKDLQQAKKRSEKLRQELDQAEQKLGEQDRQRVEELRQRLAAAEATARQAAQEMRGGYFEGLTDDVEELADQHIAKARGAADDIKTADEPHKQAIHAREADRLVDRSLQEVDELLAELEPMADVVRKAVEMDELAQRQADLAQAKLAMEQAPEDQQAPPAEDQWQEAQQALAQELGEMLDEVVGGPHEVMAADQQAAQNLAQQARQMAQEQQGLADDTRQLAQLDEALAGLARDQHQLAAEAAQEPGAQQHAAPMDQAAENIQAGNLGPAIEQQAAAEQGLQRAAQQLAQQAGEPGQAAGEPGQAAGEPGQAAGEPGQAAGEPGQAAGEPGQAAGEPGQAAGEPGQAAGEPGQAAGEPAQAAGEPGQAAGEPGQAAGEPGQAAGEPGQAAGEPGQAAGEPGQAAG
ncbi:MAG: hypothetical protein ACLF0G_13655, partial [Candidatus Brocadiia bacterium]